MPVPSAKNLKRAKHNCAHFFTAKRTVSTFISKTPSFDISLSAEATVVSSMSETAAESIAVIKKNATNKIASIDVNAMKEMGALYKSNNVPIAEQKLEHYRKGVITNAVCVTGPAALAAKVGLMAPNIQQIKIRLLGCEKVGQFLAGWIHERWKIPKKAHQLA